MSIEYDIIMDKKLVLAKGSGLITGIDVIRHLDALTMDDRYKAPMKKLVDYRTIDGIRISLKEAYSIAQKKIKLTGKLAGNIARSRSSAIRFRAKIRADPDRRVRTPVPPFDGRPGGAPRTAARCEMRMRVLSTVLGLGLLLPALAGEAAARSGALGIQPDELRDAMPNGTEDYFQSPLGIMSANVGFFARVKLRPGAVITALEVLGTDDGTPLGLVRLMGFRARDGEAVCTSTSCTIAELDLAGLDGAPIATWRALVDDTPAPALPLGQEARFSVSTRVERKLKIR